MPDCFEPPKGMPAGVRLYWLIQQVPAASRAATRCARARSRVKTPAASPNGVALARATASASPENRSTDITGPNTSSRATVIASVTPASTVGAIQKPARSRRRPPVTTRAPSASAVARWRSTVSICACVVIGPKLVRSSSGSPITARPTRSARRARKASWTASSTKTRVPFEQTWPDE